MLACVVVLFAAVVVNAAALGNVAANEVAVC